MELLFVGLGMLAVGINAGAFAGFLMFGNTPAV